MFFEKDKTVKKTPKKVCEFENGDKSSELPLEEVKCDYTVSESETLPRGSVSIPLSRTSISTPSKQTKYQSKVQFQIEI